MAHASFRAALASWVKSQDQVKRTLAGICVSATRMYNFSPEISMEEFSLVENYVLVANAIKILLPGRILGGIPEKSFFSWQDPGEYRFLGRILAEIRGGNFSHKGSHRENGPPRQDPGRILVSAGNLGRIPAKSRYLFYKGIAHHSRITLNLPLQSCIPENWFYQSCIM